MKTLKDIKGTYLWEYEESLEEALSIISPYDININILCEDHDRERQFVPGDILMVPQWHSQVSGVNSSPHRIIVVTSVNQGDIIAYTGYLLSSQINKANKNNERFPNNIFINNYDTILNTGRLSGNRPAILKVDELITFSNNDLQDMGTWKGHISDEFANFMETCINNFHRDRNLNRSIYWEREI